MPRRIRPGAPFLVEKPRRGSPPGLPFNQADWPRPRQIVAALLVSICTIPPPQAPQPFNQDEWSVPRSTLHTISLRQSQLGSPLVLLTAVAPPSQPFSQTDWSVPRGPAVAVALQTWTTSLTTTTLAQPFAQTDWQPPRDAGQRLSLRTHLDPLKLTLLGQDQFFGAAGDGPSYDYPAPRGPAYPTSLRTWTQSATLLGQDRFFGAPGQGPVYEWLTPRGAVAPTALRTWTINLTTTTLAPVVGVVPFSQTVWPVPARGGFLLVSSATRPSDQGAVAAVLPFTQTDWPLPRGTPHPIGLRTHLDALKRSLVGQDQFFGAAGDGPSYDYPTPRGPAYPIGLRTWAQSLTTTTLAPAAAPVPFTQQDWPLPRGPVSSVALRTWTFYFSPLETDEVPGQQSHWPIPQGRTHQLALRTWTQSLTTTTLAPAITAAPFNQTDWSLPRGSVAAIALRSWASSLQTTTLAPATVMPTRSFDGSLPSRSVASLALRTWTQSLQTTTLAPAVAVPFSQDDWPTPRRKQHPISQLVWLRGYVDPSPQTHQTRLAGVDVFLQNAAGLDAFVSASAGVDVFQSAAAGPDAFVSGAAGVDVFGPAGTPAIQYADAVLADGPIGYWPLGEPSGTTAIDEAPTPHNGTYVGGVTLAQPGALVDGNTAALFDGVNEYVDIGVVPALKPTAGVSVEVWIKPSNVAQAVAYVGGTGSTGNFGYSLYMTSASGLIGFNVGNGSGQQRALSTTVLQNGVWYHVVGTYDGTNVLLYLNGVLEGTRPPITGPVSYTGITTTLIGQLQGIDAGRYWPGTMDEFAIYASALSADRVATHYALRLRSSLSAGVDVFQQPGAGQDALQNNLPAGIDDVL